MHKSLRQKNHRVYLLGDFLITNGDDYFLAIL